MDVISTQTRRQKDIKQSLMLIKLRQKTLADLQKIPKYRAERAIKNENSALKILLTRL